MMLRLALDALDEAGDLGDDTAIADLRALAEAVGDLELTAQVEDSGLKDSSSDLLRGCSRGHQPDRSAKCSRIAVETCGRNGQTGRAAAFLASAAFCPFPKRLQHCTVERS